jgi:hypothetical protein
MVVTKYLTVLSGKYPANLYRIPDSAGCLNFTGYRIPVSGSGTSLPVCLASCISSHYTSINHLVFITVSLCYGKKNNTCFYISETFLRIEPSLTINTNLIKVNEYSDMIFV